MHPCQLLLLALNFHITRIIKVLLGHEISALNDPLRGTAQVPDWVYCVEKLGDEVSDFAVLISVRGLHSG